MRRGRIALLACLALVLFADGPAAAPTVEPAVRLDSPQFSPGTGCGSMTVTVTGGMATSSEYGNGTFSTTVTLTFDAGNLTGYTETFTGTTVSGQTTRATELGSWGTCNPASGAITVFGSFRTTLTAPAARTGTSDVYITSSPMSYRNYFTPDAPPPPPPPPPVDADGDGVSPPADCNDNAPGIRPGATEIRGNAVDENCDSVAAPFLSLGSRVRASWTLLSRATKVRVLDVLDVPGGSSVRTTCSGTGCPFRTRSRAVASATPRIALKPLFLSRRLRPGTVIEVRITKAETIARIYRYTVRAGRLPSARMQCLPPGARAPTAC